MNYAVIYDCDIANGIGTRVSLFVSGCTHHCKECFNSQTWDFNYGKPYTKEIEDSIIEKIEKSYILGLTILGGEPMELCNQVAILPLIKRVKESGKTVWIYSGYTWEELTNIDNKRCHGEYTEEILRNIDILVDGEFHIEEKDITLKFRGSKNQRIIDVSETLKQGQVILSKYMY